MKICRTVLSCLILPLLFSAGCKKSDEDIINKNWKMSESAAINKEISDLKKKAGEAKDFFVKADLYQNVSALETEKGDYYSASKSASEAIKFNPNQAGAHVTLGKTHLAAGRLQDAETELLTAIGITAKMSEAHYELGNVYYQKGALAQALASFDAALRMDAKHFEAFMNRGFCLYKMANFKEAEQSFLKAEALKPDNALVHKNLGILYETKLNNKPAAAAQYKKYLGLRPNAPERRAVSAWIANCGG